MTQRSRSLKSVALHRLFVVKTSPNPRSLLRTAEWVGHDRYNPRLRKAEGLDVLGMEEDPEEVRKYGE